jgi:hypothetical protein
MQSATAGQAIAVASRTDANARIVVFLSGRGHRGGCWKNTSGNDVRRGGPPHEKT